MQLGKGTREANCLLFLCPERPNFLFSPPQKQLLAISSFAEPSPKVVPALWDAGLCCHAESKGWINQFCSSQPGPTALVQKCRSCITSSPSTITVWPKGRWQAASQGWELPEGQVSWLSCSPGWDVAVHLRLPLSPLLGLTTLPQLLQAEHSSR